MAHEKLRNMYYMDATVYNEPWKLWETLVLGEWSQMCAEPLWLPGCQYRRIDESNKPNKSAYGFLHDGLKEYKRVNDIVDDAVNFGLDFETNQLIQVAFKYQETIIKQLSKEVGDDEDWLEWFIYDNDMGKRGLGVEFKNGEKISVKSVSDLIYAINHE